MKTYNVWMEGHSISGNKSGASFFGSAEANSFREACKIIVSRTPNKLSLYDEKRNTYWACELFETEEEARKSYN